MSYHAVTGLPAESEKGKNAPSLHGSAPFFTRYGSDRCRLEIDSRRPLVVCACETKKTNAHLHRRLRSDQPAFLCRGLVPRLRRRAKLRSCSCSIRLRRIVRPWAALFLSPPGRSASQERASVAEDLVIVASPPRFHAEQSINALKAGASVLCEKPMAMSAAECQAMVEAARAKRGAFGNRAFTGAFFPAFAALREIIDQQPYGALLSYSVREGSAYRWAAALRLHSPTRRPPVGASSLMWGHTSWTFCSGSSANPAIGPMPTTRLGDWR